jgi:hypothetical protein
MAWPDCTTAQPMVPEITIAALISSVPRVLLFMRRRACHGMAAMTMCHESSHAELKRRSAPGLPLPATAGEATHGALPCGAVLERSRS